MQTTDAEQLKRARFFAEKEEKGSEWRFFFEKEKRTLLRRGRVLRKESFIAGTKISQPAKASCDIGHGHCPLELMTRLELVTSSLPRMCATTCATSAEYKKQLIYYKRNQKIFQYIRAKQGKFF